MTAGPGTGPSLGQGAMDAGCCQSEGLRPGLGIVGSQEVA